MAEVKELEIKSTYKSARISTRKVIAVANSIRGKSVNEAVVDLNFQHRKAADLLKGVLNTAIANAENNYKLEKSDLYVYDVKIGPGTTMKRGRFAAKGRFKPILKRTCHMTVVLKAREDKKSSLVAKEEKVEQKS